MYIFNIYIYQKSSYYADGDIDDYHGCSRDCLTGWIHFLHWMTVTPTIMLTWRDCNPPGCGSRVKMTSKVHKWQLECCENSFKSDWDGDDRAEIDDGDAEGGGEERVQEEKRGWIWVQTCHLFSTNWSRTILTLHIFYFSPLVQQMLMHISFVQQGEPNILRGPPPQEFLN